MNPYEIYQAGLAGAEQGKQRGIASLIGKAYSAPIDQRQNALARLAQVDGPAAYDAQKHIGEMDDDGRQRLGQYAAAFDALPDEMKPQAYPQLAQQAQQLGIPAPPEWNPAYAPHIQKLAQTLGNAGSGNVQSTQILANGHIGVVTRDGRVVDTGQAASPSTQLINEPGQFPYLVTTGRGAIGQTTGIGPSAGAQQPPAQRMSDDQITAFATQMSQANVPQEQIEAWMRSQQSQPMYVGGGAPSSAPVPQRNPTAAEAAAATESAKQGVEIANLPQRGAIEAENAAKKAAAEAAAKAQAEREATVATKAVDAQRALDLLDEAERLLPLSTGSGFGNMVDAGAAMFGKSTTGAQAITALQTIAGQLTASMPRMQGPQSDKDVLLYKQMAGDLANPTLPIPSRMAALRQIRRLNQKYAGGNGDKAPSNSIGGTGGGGTVWTRDANGKLVRSKN
jgi:hypothetical protein